MADPICFRCRHFRQHQPLTFLQPGTCGWQGMLPAWLEPYSNSDDYYAPKRDIWSRSHIIEQCETFAEKPEAVEMDGEKTIKKIKSRRIQKTRRRASNESGGQSNEAR